MSSEKEEKEENMNNINNETKTQKHIKVKNKVKNKKRCCICLKKSWTNMKCECGSLYCIVHLNRELHQCKIEHVIVNKDYMMKASAAPIKVNAI